MSGTLFFTLFPSVAYGYDALDHVSTATSQATSGNDCWGQSFGYDRYANLTTINVTRGWRIRCERLRRDVCARTRNPMENTSIGHLMHPRDSQSAHSAEGFSLLEMMMVVTLILIIASIATPIYRSG